MFWGMDRKCRLVLGRGSLIDQQRVLIFCIFVKMKGYLYVNMDGLNVTELDMKSCCKFSYS